MIRRVYWFVLAGVAAIVSPFGLFEGAGAEPGGEPVVCETVPAEPGAEICATYPGHVWNGTDWIPAPTLPATR